MVSVFMIVSPLFCSQVHGTRLFNGEIVECVFSVAVGCVSCGTTSVEPLGFVLQSVDAPSLEASALSGISSRWSPEIECSPIGFWGPIGLV